MQILDEDGHMRPARFEETKEMCKHGLPEESHPQWFEENKMNNEVGIEPEDQIEYQREKKIRF
jgi:hypothetical protein